MNLLKFPESDGIVVEILDSPYDHSVRLDEDRVIRYDADNQPIAVEFIGVSDGVNLDGIPCHDEIADLLHQHHIKVPA